MNTNQISERLFLCQQPGTPENTVFMSALKKIGTDPMGFTFMISTLKTPVQKLIKDFNLTKEESESLIFVSDCFLLKI